MGHNNENDDAGQDYELEIDIKEDGDEFMEPILHPSIQRIKVHEGLLPAPPKAAKPKVVRPRSAPGLGLGLTRFQIVHDDRRNIPKKDEACMSLDEIIRQRNIPKPEVKTYGRASGADRNNKEENLVRSTDESDGTSRMLIRENVDQASSLGSLQSMSKASSCSSLRSSIGKANLVKNIKFTPTSGLRLLANEGMVIVVDVSEMNDQEKPYFRSRRWRACYYDGREGSDIQGIGEAPRKALAKEAAALDFMNKLRDARPEATVPVCEIPKGCKIHPYVMVALEGQCKKLGCAAPKYKEDLISVRGKDKYQFSITIGDTTFTEASYEIKHAKYCAAKKAYDSLQFSHFGSGEFKYDKYVTGDACLDESEFGLVESEELHVCHASVNILDEGSRATLKRKKHTVYSGIANKKFKVLSVVETPLPHVLKCIRLHAFKRMEKSSNSVESVGSSILGVL